MYLVKNEKDSQAGKIHMSAGDVLEVVLADGTKLILEQFPHRAVLTQLHEDPNYFWKVWTMHQPAEVLTSY
jgi:hypothetical protein